jgi:hypothetical protein
MLELVVVELVPVAFARPRRARGTVGAIFGGMLMLGLALLLQP